MAANSVYDLLARSIGKCVTLQYSTTADSGVIHGLETDEHKQLVLLVRRCNTPSATGKNLCDDSEHIERWIMPPTDVASFDQRPNGSWEIKWAEVISAKDGSWDHIHHLTLSIQA